jgi:hypothetical protein
MTEARSLAKFIDCLTAGAAPVAAAHGKWIAEVVQDLENHKEIGTLISLLT